jgi:Mce-associated membrane protein
MAEHADAEQLDQHDAETPADAEQLTEVSAEQSGEPEAEAPDEPEIEEFPDETEATEASKSRLRQFISDFPRPVAVALILVAAVGGLVGWLGFRSHQALQVQAEDNVYVQTARQAAVNLTTIDYTEADADIKRVLDSTTGAFRDDFQQRSDPFVEVVKQARSKSEGTVTAAGLESVNGNEAQVLLAVSVKTSMPAAPPGPPRNWRMRISVEKVGDTAKISNVQFVP